MSLSIEIFKTDDYIPDGEIPLLPVLGEVFRDIIGDEFEGVVFALFFQAIADRRTGSSEPSIVNLRSSHGYVRVRILRNGRLIYQHPHTVRELIEEPLRKELRKRDPDATHWGFGVRGPGLEAIPLVRPAPRPQHEARMTTGPSATRGMFRVEEIPEPEPPVARLSDFGVEDETDQTAPVLTIIPDPVYEALTESLDFSHEIEEGGFLIGRVFRDGTRENTHIVRVDAVIQAERTGASMLNFTFTGESFLRINQLLMERGRSEVLLGWYHTHLFAATAGLGLSSLDVELHHSTFRRPWQLAALVNITDQGRKLRLYHGVDADGRRMKMLPYWTVPR